MQLLSSFWCVNGVVEDGKVLEEDLLPVRLEGAVFVESIKVLEPDSCGQNKTIDSLLLSLKRFSREKKGLDELGFAENLLEICISTVLSGDILVQSAELVKQVFVVEMDSREELLHRHVISHAFFVKLQAFDLLHQGGVKFWARMAETFKNCV